MKIFTLVSIGCLECDNPSRLVGHYPDRESAEAAREQYSEEHGYSDNQQSHNIFESDLDLAKFNLWSR